MMWPVTEQWIRERWGGFTYLDLARNEDFSLDFDGSNLWLHYENEMQAARLLLFKNTTQQNVVDVERIFGIGLNHE